MYFNTEYLMLDSLTEYKTHLYYFILAVVVFFILLIYKVTQKNNKTTLTKIKKLPIEVSKDRQWELPIKNPNQTYEIQRNLSDVTFVFIFNFVLLIMFFVYFANWCKSVFNNKIIKL